MLSPYRWLSKTNKKLLINLSIPLTQIIFQCLDLQLSQNLKKFQMCLFIADFLKRINLFFQRSNAKTYITSNTKHYENQFLIYTQVDQINFTDHKFLSNFNLRRRRYLLSMIGGLEIDYVQNNKAITWKYKGCPFVLGIEVLFPVLYPSHVIRQNI